MGSRKISLDPAASVFGRFGLMAMKVSLCGPHSLETSTLLPTARDELGPPPGEAAFAERYWYFAHQVGLWVELFCANVCDEKNRQDAVSRAILRKRFMDGLL